MLHDKTDIRDWARGRKIEVQDIDRCYFLSGPFYITKDRRIYKVTTSDGTYWFRYGNFFSNDIEKETATGYTKIQ